MFNKDTDFEFKRFDRKGMSSKVQEIKDKKKLPPVFP